MGHSLTRQSLETGQHILTNRSNAFRKAHGQFLTPEPLARFMAEQLGTIKDGDRILDPAMGSGTLLCVIVERLIAENNPIEVWIDGFELDEELFTAAQSILNEAVICAGKHGIRVYLNLFHADFILNGLQILPLCARMDETTSPSKFSIELQGGEQGQRTCQKHRKPIQKFSQSRSAAASLPSTNGASLRKRRSASMVSWVGCSVEKG